MSHEIIVQFVGFGAADHTHVYSFTVCEPSAEPRNCTLTSSNRALDDHLIGYQDGPDSRSLKLHRELAAYSNHPTETRLDMTDADLEDYRSTDSPRKTPSPFVHKPSEEY